MIKPKEVGEIHCARIKCKWVGVLVKDFDSEKNMWLVAPVNKKWKLKGDEVWVERIAYCYEYHYR